MEPTHKAQILTPEQVRAELKEARKMQRFHKEQAEIAKENGLGPKSVMHGMEAVRYQKIESGLVRELAALREQTASETNKRQNAMFT